MPSASTPRNRYDTKITQASHDPASGRVRVSTTGKAALPLSLYLFAGEGLEYRVEQIPAFQGEQTVDSRMRAAPACRASHGPLGSMELAMAASDSVIPTANKTMSQESRSCDGHGRYVGGAAQSRRRRWSPGLQHPCRRSPNGKDMAPARSSWDHAAEVLGKVPRSGQAFGLAALVDETAAEALKKYAVRTVLPKPPSPASGGKAVDRSSPMGGAGSCRLARKHHCYLIVPLELLEDARSAWQRVRRRRPKRRDRGRLPQDVPAVQHGTENMEEETPGSRRCSIDFGKLGVQICFDMEFDQGWEELAREDWSMADASPQTTHPAAVP